MYHTKDDQKQIFKKITLCLTLSASFFLGACGKKAPSNDSAKHASDHFIENPSSESTSNEDEDAKTDSKMESELESEPNELQALYREDDDGNPVEGWLTDDDGTVGYCQNGYLMTGYQMIDGSRYLFTEDGDMRTGSYTDENGDKYCFTDDGRQYFCSTVKCEDGYYYYFGDDGKAVTGDFTFSDGSTGMTDADGHVYAGKAASHGRCYTSDGRTDLRRWSFHAKYANYSGYANGKWCLCNLLCPRTKCGALRRYYSKY